MEQAQQQRIYEEAKAKLNPEQRQAVETIDGPVMVLAGPGTGKTQVLAFRVAEILLRSDVSPRNILALTFTESGVTAMRERLVSLIGVTAYGVGIYTFHSFANRVIQESGAEFYKSHSLDQIDDIAQFKLVMRLVDELGNELLRPPRAPYFFVRPIVGAIKNLKSEGIEPNQLRTLCREAIVSLETDESSVSKSGKTKGDIKQTVKEQIKRFERSIALADVYERYQDELDKQGLYDYEDMILFVLKTFESNPDLKAQYQEQFQFILVDEYQDTNNAQNRLVRILSDYFDNPNLFVVGDDKQSIYRFQGASMANLLNFREWYPQAKLISLRQNYRSGQVILDNAHTLIEQNKEQLGAVIPGLHTELSGQTPTGAVSFTPYPSDDREVLGVVTAIKQLLTDGVSASEIAIIYRENSEAQRFVDLLNRQGVPFHLEAGNDVLKDSDVRHLLNLLRLAMQPNDENALFHYLHAPYSGIATVDLIRLGRWARSERQSWWQILEGEGPHADFPLNWEQVQATCEKVREWYRFAVQHNLGETVEHVFLDSGLLQFIMAQSDSLERLHRIRAFFDDVKRLIATEPFAKLRDLFDRIEIRQTYNLSLMCAPLVERSDAAIRLMTAHKSKGLEFEHVFIPGFVDGRWGNTRKSSLLTLPAGIIPHHETNDEQTVEEERRLFYVAVTRAKQSVYISCAEFDTENRKQLPCQFLTELSGVTHRAPVLGESALSLGDFFSPVQARFVDATSQAYLREIVSKQAITPTSLNTYLQCPMEYLYRTVYAIPGVREADQAYGTAIHKALELWGNWSKTEATPYGLETLVAKFVEALTKEGLTESELKRYQHLGETVLSAYYAKHAASWRPALATEYSFTPHAVMLDGKVPITGKFDKIEAIRGSKHVRVVDYKTGKVRSRNDIIGATASSDGDYKRQLVFYTVLAEADPFFPYTIGEATIAFIDDDCKFTEETFTITDDEKRELRELIHHVYTEVNALHFDHTPHKRRYGKGESLCDLLRIEGVMPTVIADVPKIVKQETLELIP